MDVGIEIHSIYVYRGTQGQLQLVEAQVISVMVGNRAIAGRDAAMHSRLSAIRDPLSTQSELFTSR